MSSYCTVFSLQTRSIRQGSGSESELSDFPPQSRYTCKSLFIAQLSVGRVDRLTKPRQVDFWDKIRVFHLALLRSSCFHLLTFAFCRGERHVERNRHKHFCGIALDVHTTAQYCTDQVSWHECRERCQVLSPLFGACTRDSAWLMYEFVMTRAAWQKYKGWTFPLCVTQGKEEAARRCSG